MMIAAHGAGVASSAKEAWDSAFIDAGSRLGGDSGDATREGGRR